MNILKILLPVAAMLLLGGQAAAQTGDEEALRDAKARKAEMEERLRAAEAQMEEAARTIAEITKERLPRIEEIESRYALANKPRLGITIDSEGEPGPVEGVEVLGVTPGSAAYDAGLRSGDILTAINDEALSADSCKEANMRLLDFMSGVEEGDVLRVEYLRDGKVGSVEVEPSIVTGSAFVWMDDGKMQRSFAVPAMPLDPQELAEVREFKMQFAAPWMHTGLGELELVELNEGLGRYFGTDKGLLVVSAPKSDAFDLQDGDVIQSIDGREPKDARHAMRILGSYQSGEKLKLGIMRDKKKMTLAIEMPADHHGQLYDFDIDVRPAAAPAPAPAPAPLMAPIPLETPVAPAPAT